MDRELVDEGGPVDLFLDPALCQGYSCELRHRLVRGEEEPEDFPFTAKPSDKGTHANESLKKRMPRTHNEQLHKSRV